MEAPMTTDLQPVSQVTPLALVNRMNAPIGYFRSKLFVAPNSSNPLVSAAGPIFSVLERIGLSSQLPPIEVLRDNLDHELKAYHSRLDAAQLPEDTLSIAHYLLCCTIDELVGKNYMRVYQIAPEFKAFTPLTHDDAQPQVRFFEILEYIRERPNQYLDLIEFTYYCLIAGFEGAYHLKANGRQSLDNFTEELFQLIQKFRFNKAHQLFSEAPLPKAMEMNYRSTMITLAIAACVVLGSYFVSRIVLENKAESVLFGHSQLVMLDN